LRWKGVPFGLTPQQNTDTLILVIDASFVPRKPIQ
uniref:Transposase n=1 Tax=Anisakis simplex TaxID=6269 RepID=A0A0M3KKB5_ANISI